MEKGKERRKQLLTVALDEFITKGFCGTSTREICRKAGISSGLLFHYFPNKESIYLELVKTEVDKMCINTAEALKAPKKYLYHTLQEIFEQLKQNTFFRKMFVFMDQAQHVHVEMEEVRILLDQADIVKQWVPVIDSKRNLIYFIIITLISGWIGVFIDLILTGQPEGNSLGMGIWLVLPFLCGIVFRIRIKDWKGFGLSLNIKTGWKGYVIAVFIYPAITSLAGGFF